MAEESKSCGVIILAAGNSSRLGEPKQLLQYQNKSLIRHVAEEAIKAIQSPVIVVTGSNSELIANELIGLSIHLIHNADWMEGMASSIRVGLRELLIINKSIENVIFAVSDQPFVTADLFRSLIDKQENSHRLIVASSYENTVGTPVLFGQKYFDSLLSLNGSEGAKKLLQKFQDDVTTVPFPLGSVDIDTQEDYQRLLTS